METPQPTIDTVTEMAATIAVDAHQIEQAFTVASRKKGGLKTYFTEGITIERAIFMLECAKADLIDKMLQEK